MITAPAAWAALAMASSSAGGGGGASAPPPGGGGGGGELLSHLVELVAKKENWEGEIPAVVVVVGLDPVAPILYDVVYIGIDSEKSK